MLRRFLSGLVIASSISFSLSAQTANSDIKIVDFEGDTKLTLITKDADCVCFPMVKRKRNGIEWLTNRILAVSPERNELAFLSLKENNTNIYIKDLDKPGISRQRTNRSAIIDFSYSPDGDKLCFTEQNGDYNSMFITDAHKGFICRQLTTGSLDYSPVYDKDAQKIYFVRMGLQGPEIWSYDLRQNYLSSYTSGMNPYPSPDGQFLYFARTNKSGRGEIWRLNLNDGAEECIISDPTRSFFSPLPSPDGERLLLVGSSKIQIIDKMGDENVYWNTDIFTCNTDGTELRQRTYNSSDDLSPVWSRDGKRVYYISQRGNANGNANIWSFVIE